MKFVAMCLVASFGFLLASFPARNADLWKHLSEGRQLASDFAFSPEGREGSFPRDQSWLYDLLCYAIFSAAGGGGLVFAKALVVAGCALVMFQMSKAETGYVLPAAFTLLAVLTMSTRLFLEPATISCLFFALSLWFAIRETRKLDLAEKTQPIVPPWPLLVLFVIWSNTDSWFLVGLATMVLGWIGKFFDGSLVAFRSHWRGAISLGLLGAACLLNPYHLHAFSPLADLLTVQQPLGYSSPFQSAYFSSLGWTPAGLAFYFLLALGVVSFILNLQRWQWGRFLPWIGLALFSCFQVNAIPLLAVFSAPMLLWNFSDWIKRRGEPRPTPGVSASPGRVIPLFGVALGVALLVCAWPGWLQAPPYEPRRWAIETNPAFERVGTVTRVWQEEGKFGPDARALHLSPETASAFSWHCHECDPFLASALLGYPHIASDWEERLRKAKINHVVVVESGSGGQRGALAKFFTDPDLWPLLYQEGNLAVFGWRDPAEPKSKDLFRKLKLDLNRLAFHPNGERKAPRERPDREPEPRRWYDGLRKPQPTQSLDADEATLHLLHAEILRSRAPQRNLIEWEISKAVELVAAAASWTVPSGVIDCQQRLVFFRPLLPAAGAKMNTLPALDQWALKAQEMYSLERDDVPPALLYLAIRSARRALGVNPGDPQAHVVLGESYLRLLRNTREGVWGIRLKQLTQLRRVQASAALNQAILLKPNLAKAHRLLGGLYSEMGYLDLALKHFRAHRKLVSGRGQAFQDQVGNYDLEIIRLAEAVQEREKKHGGAAGTRVLDRAVLANQMGLAGKARDLLLESDITAFGRTGMALELDLLLKTGRIKEVRDWTGEDQKDMLGEISYYWIRAQALAASGDYRLSAEQLATLAIAWQGKEGIVPRERMALEIAKTVLEEQPLGRGTWAHQVWRTPGRVEFRDRILAIARRLKEEANALVLRGLLALEEGEVDNARVAFRAALALWKDEASADSGAGLDFDARPIAQECLKWLD